MSVEPDHLQPGAGDGADRLFERAAEAETRAARRLAATVDDYFLAETDRLDEQMRAAIAAAATVLVRSVVGDIAQHAGRVLAGRGETKLARRLAAAEAPAIARLKSAPCLRDSGLMSELVVRAWQEVIAAHLPVSAPDEPDRPSLLARLANGPDRVAANAATAVMAAEGRRRAAVEQGGHTGSDLPAELHHRLVWAAAAALRRGLGAIAPDRAQPADLALVEAAQRALAAHDEGERLEAAVARLAAALDPQPDELPAMLDEMIADRRLALLIATLGQSLGIAPETARDIVLDPAGDRFWLALRALDLKRAVIARVGLALSEADRRRNPEAFADLLDTIMAIPADTALATVASWRLPADYRTALRDMAGEDDR